MSRIFRPKVSFAFPSSIVCDGTLLTLREREGRGVGINKEGISSKCCMGVEGAGEYAVIGSSPPNINVKCCDGALSSPTSLSVLSTPCCSTSSFLVTSSEAHLPPCATVHHYQHSCSSTISCGDSGCGGGSSSSYSSSYFPPYNFSSISSKSVWEQRRTFFTATPIYRRRPAGRVNSRTANRNKRQREPKPGDWTCQCGTVNFRARRECYQCNAPAPPLPPGVKRLRLPGEDPNDWACPCGSMNYRGNVNCFKCHMPKPAPAPLPGEETEFWKCSNCIQINRPKRSYCFQCYGLKVDNAMPVPEGPRLLTDGEEEAEEGEEHSGGALKIVGGDGDVDGDDDDELNEIPPPVAPDTFGAEEGEGDEEEAGAAATGRPSKRRADQDEDDEEDEAIN